MKGALPPVSDDDLHALVDGQIDPGQYERLSRHLVASPADAARVEAWRRQNNSIRSAFAHIITEPVPLSLRLAAQGKHRIELCRLFSGRVAAMPLPLEASEATRDSPKVTKQIWPIGIGFATGLALAATTMSIASWLNWQDGGSGNARPALATERQHSLEESTAAALTSLLPQLTDPVPAAKVTDGAESHSPLIVPNLAYADLTFVGVKVSSDGTSPAVCVFYAMKSSAKVALCVEKGDPDPLSDFRVTEGAGPRTISWAQKGAKYAVAGALPERDLRRIAAQAHADVEAFDFR